MKFSQIAIGVGATAALGLLAWQLYMAQTPPYQRAQQRGLPADMAKAKEGTERSKPAANKADTPAIDPQKKKENSEEK